MHSMFFFFSFKEALERIGLQKKGRKVCKMKPKQIRVLDHLEKKKHSFLMKLNRPSVEREQKKKGGEVGNVQNASRDVSTDSVGYRKKPPTERCTPQ